MKPNHELWSAPSFSSLFHLKEFEVTTGGNVQYFTRHTFPWIFDSKQAHVLLSHQKWEWGSLSTWCTAPSTSAVLEIRSTVPPRMSSDSSSLCRILVRLLSRHRPFSVWKQTSRLSVKGSFLIIVHWSFTAPPGSPCLWSAPGGCSPQPGFERAPPPAASASGCTGHNGRPGRSERRPSASKNNIYFSPAPSCTSNSLLCPALIPFSTWKLWISLKLHL